MTDLSTLLAALIGAVISRLTKPAATSCKLFLNITLRI